MPGPFPAHLPTASAVLRGHARHSRQEGHNMLLEVKCFATLARFQPRREDIPLGPNPTVRDLIGYLGMPESEVKISFVNGVHAGPDHELHDGDRVGLFPAVGGG